MDWPEYFNLVKGRKALFEKQSLLMRTMVTMTYNINRGKNAAMTEKQVMAFSIDKEEKSSPVEQKMSKEERQEFLKKKAENYGLKVVKEDGKVKIDGQK